MRVPARVPVAVRRKHVGRRFQVREQRRKFMDCQNDKNSNQLLTVAQVTR